MKYRLKKYQSHDKYLQFFSTLRAEHFSLWDEWQLPVFVTCREHGVITDRRVTDTSEHVEISSGHRGAFIHMQLTHLIWSILCSHSQAQLMEKHSDRCWRRAFSPLNTRSAPRETLLTVFIHDSSMALRMALASIKWGGWIQNDFINDALTLHQIKVQFPFMSEYLQN